MPSASLAVVRRVHPQPVRITALSAAIAVNLAVIIVALRPMAPQLIQALQPTQTTTVNWIDPPPPAIPVPPIVLPQVVPKPTPVKIVVPHAVPITHEGSQTSPPVTTPTLAPPSTPQVVAPPTVQDVAPPGEVSLAYRTSPLRFPAQALRRHMQGTVLLRVLVDENGKPVDVQVEQSSGYALLDQSAREQVLAGWQFQPSIVNGHPARTWARVPVSFIMKEL